jgi:hypothetical protein
VSSLVIVYNHFREAIRNKPCEVISEKADSVKF